MRIYATFHPSSVIEGGYHLERYIIDDLRRFKQKRLGAPRKMLPRRGARVVGFDTEYDPQGHLLTVGLSDGKRAGAIECSDSKWKSACAPIIRSAKVLVGHSVEGDIDYLVRNKLAKEEWLQGRNVLDSFLLARMVDENRGKGGYGLEPLLLSEFSFNPWKLDTEKLLKKTGNAADWSVEQRTERCRKDAWATRVLAETLLQRADAEIKSVQKRRLT